MATLAGQDMDHIGFLRAAFESPEHLNSLAEALTSGQLLRPEHAVMLNHLVNIGWVEERDITIARAMPGLVAWRVACPVDADQKEGS